MRTHWRLSVKFLEKYDLPHLPPVDVFLEILSFVLKNNIFSFNGEMYHQLYGVAMGTKLAPALATIYLALLEEAYLNTTPTPPFLYLRYIDDILWSGPMAEMP